MIVGAFVDSAAIDFILTHFCLQAWALPRALARGHVGAR